MISFRVSATHSCCPFPWRDTLEVCPLGTPDCGNFHMGQIVPQDCTLLLLLDSGNVLWVRVPKLARLLPRLNCDSRLSPTVGFGTSRNNFCCFMGLRVFVPNALPLRFWPVSLIPQPQPFYTAFPTAELDCYSVSKVQGGAD